MSDAQAFTLEEFCRAYRISQAHYWRLRRSGKGPAEIKVGRRVLISKEAADAWRRRMEDAGNGGPPQAIPVEVAA